MTADVKKILNKISHDEIFDEELYFTGGTALAYYLDHRVSEDIDIVSSKPLPYKKVIPNLVNQGAVKIEDENITALKLAGLFPNEYIIKFIIDNVKLEFFQANRPIQKEILSQATFSNFENSKLKILDLKSIAKLKIVALVMRDKSRDLFDFGSILDHKVLSNDEILKTISKVNSNIVSQHDIIEFIKSKKESLNDEAVYLNETNKIHLTFEEIKEDVIRKLY